MEKKRARVITGWRQVASPKLKLSRPRSTPAPGGKATPGPRVAVSERAANERWEAEGGQLVEPAK